MGDIFLYETRMKADDDDGDFLLKLEIPASPQVTLALHSDDAQESNAASIEVVSIARHQVLESRPWTCAICHNRPATGILGKAFRLERPGGYEPAKFIDDDPIPICDDAECVSRATRRVNKAIKQLSKGIEVEEPLNIVPYICVHCAKEESADGGPKLKRCARCKIAWYCNESCQKADWKKHKQFCSKLVGMHS